MRETSGTLALNAETKPVMPALKEQLERYAVIFAVAREVSWLDVLKAVFRSQENFLGSAMFEGIFCVKGAARQGGWSGLHVALRISPALRHGDHSSSLELLGLKALDMLAQRELDPLVDLESGEGYDVTPWNNTFPKCFIKEGRRTGSL